MANKSIKGTAVTNRRPLSDAEWKIKRATILGHAHRSILSAAPPKSHTLGYGGDYEHPDSDSRQRAARRHFLVVINHRYSVVMESLWHHVFPDYRRVRKPADSHEYYFWEEQEIEATASICEIPSLHSWADRFFLNTRWVKQCAISTMARWVNWSSSTRFPGYEYDLPRALRHGWDSIGTAYFPPLTDDEARFNVPAQSGYQPDRESRQQACFRLRQEYEAHLTSHLDTIEGLMGERGWTKKKETRTADHFDWAADFQVGGLDYSEIARQRHVARKTVVDGVKSLLEDLLDLSPRPSAPGRRPKIPS